jgi:hypothetical protein
MRRKHIVLTICVLSLGFFPSFNLLGQGNTGSVSPGCPKCFKNQNPLPGAHGSDVADDGSPRRVLNIFIENSSVSPDNWNSGGGLDPRIVSATQTAATRWNTAIDDVSHPTERYTTNYFFEIKTDRYQADFILAKTFTGKCASIDTSSYPHVIRVRADLIDRLTTSQLAGLIAHELGHRIGLANAYDDPDCSLSSTIMNGTIDENDCEPLVERVHARDVFMSNRNADPNTIQQTCTATDTTTQNEDGSGGGCESNCNGEDTPTCDPYGMEDSACVGRGGQFDHSDCVCRTCEETYGYQYCCPVIVDTDGNGFSLTNDNNGVDFDLNGDGIRNRFSWTKPNSDDAWLSLDRDGNGSIDNGQELFGNFTPQPNPPSGVLKNGFNALAEYDKAINGGNGDGVINSNDAIYNSLRLWQDSNHNGISEPNELHTLSEMDIAVLHLDYKESKKTDEHGNLFKYRAKVSDAKGARAGRWAWDVSLQTTLILDSVKKPQKP